MNKQDNHNLKDLSDYLKTEIPRLYEKIENVERAIYGDQVNKVKGLIDYNKQSEIEIHKIDEKFSQELSNIRDRVSRIEQIKNKLGWVVSGLVTGASVGGASIWEWITKMK